MDSEMSRPDLASTHPPIQWALEAVSLKRDQPVWSDHSPPSSTKIKNEWSYTSSPSYACMERIGMTLSLPYHYKIKHI